MTRVSFDTTIRERNVPEEQISVPCVGARFSRHNKILQGTTDYFPQDFKVASQRYLFLGGALTSLGKVLRRLHFILWTLNTSTMPRN